VALPVANFYDEPQLAALLPVAGLGAFIQGCQSMRLATANRHIALGRLTAMELSAQVIGISMMVLLAWWLQSVWSLLIGTLMGISIKTLMSHWMLPGPKDRLGWDRDAFWEIFHFGKYIFIGSMAGFAINHADRAVLGKFISMADLGVYNIGFFMASIPTIIAQQLGGRVLMPLYAKTPPREGPENRWKIRLARMLLTTVLMGLGVGFALTGEWLIGVLYEEEYALAGPIMVLLSLTYLPMLVFNAYPNLMLASGKSRNFTIYLIFLGALQLTLLIFLVRNYGILGAVLTPGMAAVLIYPVIAWFAHREKAWDPILDLGFMVIIGVSVTVVLNLQETAISEVVQRVSG
jgi:O-antigen/teichoic acid export membrane protein